MKKKVFAWFSLIVIIFLVPVFLWAAPGRITDLSASAITDTKVILSWTAPAPLPTSCPLVEYDVRHSLTAINSLNWATRTQVIGEPAPANSGTQQNMLIRGLSPKTTYYFAIKTKDSCGVWSILSNLAVVKTLDIYRTVKASIF